MLLVVGQESYEPIVVARRSRRPEKVGSWGKDAALVYVDHDLCLCRIRRRQHGTASSEE